MIPFSCIKPNVQLSSCTPIGKRALCFYSYIYICFPVVFSIRQNIGFEMLAHKRGKFSFIYLCWHFHGICIRRINGCLLIYRIYIMCFCVRYSRSQAYILYDRVWQDGRFLSCEQTGRVKTKIKSREEKKTTTKINTDQQTHTHREHSL